MALVDDLIKKEFNPRRVGIVEFSESDEFCNKKLYPLQQVLMKLIYLEEMAGWEEDILTQWINGGQESDVEICPQVRERRDWLIEHGYKHFNEICLVGGRRSSKGHLTGLCIAKQIYEVQQIPDPSEHFGLDIDKAIYFACVAAALHQAKTLQFADAYSSVRRCKALEPFLGKQLEEELSIHTEADLAYVAQMLKEGKQIGKDWAKLRLKPLAANADTLRGYTTLVAVFDEMAFFQTGESALTAEACFSALEPSLAQFGRDAMIFLNSSPYSEVGEFFTQVQNSLALDDHDKPDYPMNLSFRFPSWELYRDHAKLAPGRFRSAIIVSPDWPDITMNEEEKAIKFKEQKREKANPEAYRVERRAQWAAVVDAYLNPLAVDRAFLPFWGERPMVMNIGGSSYVFAPYMAHADPSSTTAGFGFALGHVEFANDDNFPNGTARHVVFDLIKRWNPQDFPGHTINYLKVQEEIGYLMQIYTPDEITFDPVNSLPLIQGLNKFKADKNIPSVRLYDTKPTNAQNWQRWECLKTCLNLGLVHIPPDCINPDPKSKENWSDYAKLELKFLVEKKLASGSSRVDPNPIAQVRTKDMADCIREVVYKFLGSFIGEYFSKALGDARVAYGGEQGYRIGGIKDATGPANPKDFAEFYTARRPGQKPIEMATRGIIARKRR